MQAPARGVDSLYILSRKSCIQKSVTNVSHLNQLPQLVTAYRPVAHNCWWQSTFTTTTAKNLWTRLLYGLSLYHYQAV